MTTQTRLRTPHDQRIYYHPAENPTLEDKMYRVADLEVQEGQGGLLMAEPAAGTVIRFR